MMENHATCVLFAQDRSWVARALPALLMQRGLYAVRAATADECIRLLHKQIRDLLVIDVDGDMSMALALAARAREVLPQTPELVFVERGNVTAAVGAIKAGATDCLESPAEATRLARTLDELLSARVRRLREVQRVLTPMELTVLRHVLEGQTSRAIARMLHRSRRTIDVHRRRVMRKLGVSNLVGLVKWAVQEGFLDREEGIGATRR